MLELKESQVLSLPIELVAANPYQPRSYFDRMRLDELSESIKEYGVLQPITVRLINGSSYELVAGERRLRASKLAGKTLIPAIVINMSDSDSAMLALIENLQRQDLNYFEEAEGLYSLIADFSYTQEQLAKRIGKNQSTIANKLRLLRLPKSVRQSLIENNLTERHARALLRLDSEEQMQCAVKRIIENGLNVSKTEEMIEKTIRARNKPETKANRIKTYIKDMRIFTNTIKHAVDTMKKSGVATEYEIEESKDGCIITIALMY